MFKEEAIRERKEFKKEVYEKIFAITKKPKKVLDLGCGLHPLYFPYKEITYYAIDNDSEAIRKVKKYFKKNKINGKVYLSDIENQEEINRIGKVDCLFMFKVLDKIKKSTIRNLLKEIKTNYIIISFATRTIQGKRMNNPKRIWFEKMIKKYEHEKIRFFNEIFYVIKKD